MRDAMWEHVISRSEVWRDAFWAALACGNSEPEAKKFADLKERWEAPKEKVCEKRG